MTNLPVKVEHLSDAFGESTSSASSELCLDSQDMQLLPSPPPLIKVSNCSDVTQSCSAGSMSSSDIIQSHSVHKYAARRPQGDASFSPHHVNLIGKSNWEYFRKRMCVRLVCCVVMEQVLHFGCFVSLF